MRSLAKSPPNRPLASKGGTNARSIGLIALKRQNGMSKRHRHHGRVFAG